MPAIDVAGEFETIEWLLRPLAHGEWGRGLADDVAVLPARPGFDLVLTQDALVEGVHFLPDDPMDTVAQKLLRVNLSDLAAKGAEAFGYLLTCAWSPRCGWPERVAFAEGLKRDQDEFGVALMGGDTVSMPGPATFSATLLGWVPKGRTVARRGARAGDLLFVTGTIGDGGLGLMAAQGRLPLEPERVAAMLDRYRRPSPRHDFAEVIRAHATASVDVSDGLVADVGRLATASGLAAELDLEKLPLSSAGAAWFEGRVDPEAALVDLATGGDDYEIAFAAPASAEGPLRREAERRHLRLTRLGRFTEGAGVAARWQGRPVVVRKAGWTHV
ncbi:thiamine-phosphate kinase [Brevundimonas sp.]|uniref:thiamine-phosphate kinase n=1 Tax=Brevundimonas sp. TaxID=1871086 RepID=UPI0026112014|nr:thiamine-phosphate kinase [Brevundimonas sp.]